MLLPPLHLRVLLSEIIISGNKSALKTRLFSEIFLNISLFLPIHDIISLFEKILAEVDIMIYTVTFNPSLDYIVSVKDFKLWNTNGHGTDAPRWKGTQRIHGSEKSRHGQHRTRIYSWFCRR